MLDTDFIRTGLHYQLSNGIPPRSPRTARLRLFMEHDTLAETSQRLPRFAGQLGVPVAELRGIIDEDWLPHVDVVRLPDSLLCVPRISSTALTRRVAIRVVWP